MGSDDPGLDTVAAFLKALADHLVSPNRNETNARRDEALAWMRHLTIGGAHPQGAETTRRDFAGAKRFATQTLAKTHATQISTTNQLRDTTWAFVSSLQTAIGSDAAADLTMWAKLDGLRAALSSDSLEDLRRATQVACRDMFVVLDEQRGFRQQQAKTFADKMPELFDLLEADQSFTVDKTTGFLDASSLRKVAEKIAPLSTMANEPVSVIILSVTRTGGQPLDKSCDEVMQLFAPAISRTFFRRFDIVGRDADSRFGVIASGCDVESARKMTERAIAATARVGRPQHLPDLILHSGIAPLGQPVSDSFSIAQRSAA